MRKRRVTATRELQHDTSPMKFFVLGAPAMLLATRWVQPPIDHCRGGQSDHSGKTILNFLKFTRPIHTNAHQSIASNVSD